MILHLPQTRRANVTLPRTLVSAILTYIALPATAALHAGFVVWALSHKFTLYTAIADLIAALPRPLRTTFEGLIDTYAAFLGATLFAFLLSWVGFALLLPIFHAQRKLGWDGVLPTALIGALLGGLAVMPISLGPLDFHHAARAMFGANPTPFFTAMGALHASVYWAFLITFTAKPPRSRTPKALPFFVPQISKDQLLP